MNDTIHHSLPKVVHLFSQHIHTNPCHLDGTDTTSVLELIYITYTETLGRDPEDIRQGFEKLGTIWSSYHWMRITLSLLLSVNCVTPTKNEPSWMPSNWELT